MALYSYKNQEPTELPFRVLDADGNSRTDLASLNNTELSDLGFEPATKPTFDESTHYLVWDHSSGYVVTAYTADELDQKQRVVKSSKFVNYEGFWTKLNNGGSNGGATEFLKKLRGAAITNTEMSVIYSEFMNLISEAKLGLVNTSRIQNYIQIIFLKLSFTDAEKTEFQNILDSTCLNVNHEMPDATFLSTHTYNSTLNEVVPPDDGNEG